MIDVAALRDHADDDDALGALMATLAAGRKAEER